MNLLNSTTFESMHSFNLSENIEPKDNTSNTPMRHQAWFGWGKPGNITGNLLYLNFGSRRDYELLQKNYSFNFTDYDYIAIAKYGGGLSRHNKVSFFFCEKLDELPGDSTKVVYFNLNKQNKTKNKGYKKKKELKKVYY